MDIQQAIELTLFERFQAEGIEFACPAQSLYVQGSFCDGAVAGQTKRTGLTGGEIPA